jgi:hypothetical protein
MISLATEMQKRSPRGTPFILPPSPTMLRSSRSLRSTHRFHEIVRGIYFEFVAVMNVIIDQSRNQIVCYGNRMDIAGKVQIDFFHRNNLRPSATARTTLYAEAGA